MVHDLTPKPYTVYLTYDVDFVPQTSRLASGMTDVTPAGSTCRTATCIPCSTCSRARAPTGRSRIPTTPPSAYAGGTPKNEWTVYQPGVLVQTFGHLHPGGLRVDLDLVRDGKEAHLFASKAKYYEPAGAVSWDVSMTATPRRLGGRGAAGRRAEHHRHVRHVTRRRGTSRWASRSCGCTTVPAATTRSSRRSTGRGVLTHGHLPENDNHGGEEDDARGSAPEAAVRPARPPASTSRTSRTAHGDLSGPQAARHRPSRRAESITFDNLDADAQTSGTRSPRARRRAPSRPASRTPSPTAASTFDSGQLGDRRRRPRPATANLEHARRPRPRAPTPTSAASTRSCAAPSGVKG